MKTIKGGPWDYLPLLNTCIRLLLTIAIGIVGGYLKVFDAETFVPEAIKFVFNVKFFYFSPIVPWNTLLKHITRFALIVLL
jgi:hypothetical protein